MAKKEYEMTKEDLRIMAGLEIGPGPEKVKNPFSGEEVELCPEAVALYDFVKGAEMIGDEENKMAGLHLFRNRWPDEYYVLLD